MWGSWQAKLLSLFVAQGAFIVSAVSAGQAAPKRALSLEVEPNKSNDVEQFNVNLKIRDHNHESRASIDRRCCILTNRYGIVWGETWGSAPEEEALWYAEHSCSLYSCNLAQLAISEEPCCKPGPGGYLEGSLAPNKAIVANAEDGNGTFVFRSNNTGHRRLVRTESASPASSRAFSMKRLAIMWTGQRQRVIVQPTINNLVRPIVNDGHSAEVFMDLAGLNLEETSGKKTEAVWWQHSYTKEGHPVKDPALGNLEPGDFITSVRDRLQRFGGALHYLRISSKPDVLDPLPTFTRNRMWVYSPCCNKVGQSVIRRLKAYQRTWKEVETQEQLSGTKYDYVVNQRDDAYWANPFYMRTIAKRFNELIDAARNSKFDDHHEVSLQPRRIKGSHKPVLRYRKFGLEGLTNSSNDEIQEPVIFLKGCSRFGPISDKVFVMNREGAGRFSSTAYDDYYHISTKEPKGGLDFTDGAEEYLYKYMKFKNITVAEASFIDLGVLDGQWNSVEHKAPVICYKDFYSHGCDPLPDIKPCAKIKEPGNNTNVFFTETVAHGDIIPSRQN